MSARRTFDAVAIAFGGAVRRHILRLRTFHAGCATPIIRALTRRRLIRVGGTGRAVCTLAVLSGPTRGCLVLIEVTHRTPLAPGVLLGPALPVHVLERVAFPAVLADAILVVAACLLLESSRPAHGAVAADGVGFGGTFLNEVFAMSGTRRARFTLAVMEHTALPGLELVGPALHAFGAHCVRIGRAICTQIAARGTACAMLTHTICIRLAVLQFVLVVPTRRALSTHRVM